MAIRMAEVAKFAYIDEFLFCYRTHSDSISGKNASLRWNNGFMILNKAKKRFPYSRKVIRKRKAVLHFRVAQCNWEKHDLWPTVYHLLLAGILDPLRALKVCCGLESTGGLH
jgi:hypothetical protein